ncbi:peptidoglycan recognition family protein [Lipingzhangella sp. LS1_29]|uniref:Peptidoglycan recognition family protein n=1 Tax=Lipingzhangella rawalii TaxID=2055835 RepID=A0ABU2H0G9_9ACTN|nr:peptidoglycan recognition family protein [Lipingzhangella rawalii]MDS1268797.1 peptidoglycan recognition family protein [Lipingzhangella rawalii]
MGRHRRRRTTPDPSRREILGGGAMLAAAVLLGGSGSPPAEADPASPAVTPAAPRIHDRSDWQAREPEWPARVLDDAPSYIVVHHTATPNVSDQSQSRAFELSRAIQRHHMQHNGWSDTGQQLTISRGGYLMEGRNGSLEAIRSGRQLLGAHVRDHNPVTVGIENEGTYHDGDPPTELYDTLVETCAWLCDTYALEPQAIVGHRDLITTTCPGDQLYAMLPQLRADVAASLGIGSG